MTGRPRGRPPGRRTRTLERNAERRLRNQRKRRQQLAQGPVTTMNLNYETYIKQEFLNEEDDLNTFPIADFNIPIKNEPISDEITPLVTIKTEPLSETIPTAFVSQIKTEDPIQSQISIPGNSFIVYELETPSVTQDVRQVMSTQKTRQFINEASCSKTELNPLHSITQTPANPNTALVTQIFQNPASNNTTAKTTTKVTPPVLLNDQLRKRNKVVVHTNTVDKIARYNIKAVKASINAIEPTVTSQATSVGSKKIINHLIKNKLNQRKLGDQTVNVWKRLELEKRKSVALQNKIPLMELNDKPSESITENLVNFNTNINSTSVFIKTIPPPALAKNANTSKDTLNTPELTKQLEREKRKNVVLQNKIPLMELNEKPSESLTDNLVNSTTNNHSNSLFTATTTSQALTEDSKTPKVTLNIPELRVKCLCSLTADTSNDLSYNLEMRDFFKEMFEKTRRLNKKQQRKIRMTLLQAILDAEESVERGKCCGF